MGIYTDLFNKNQYQLADAAKKSQSWFQQQARLLSKQNVQPLKLIKSEPDRNKHKVVPGNLYLFMYDPKTQDKLPYWDMFPLVFPFRATNDGFYGLNMHYLPYQMRIQLLDRLMDFATNKSLNENTRLKLSWGTIAGVARFKTATPTVHRYLTSQLQSPLTKIDATDWASAMLLPVERFVGASKGRVWTESLRK